MFCVPIKEQISIHVSSQHKGIRNFLVWSKLILMSVHSTVLHRIEYTV